jgi:hypothetical protein
MCSNESYSKVHIDKNLLDIFSIQNVLKQQDALSPLFVNFVLEYAITKVQKKKKKKRGLELNGTHTTPGH